MDSNTSTTQTIQTNQNPSPHHNLPPSVQPFLEKHILICKVTGSGNDTHSYTCIFKEHPVLMHTYIVSATTNDLINPQTGFTIPNADITVNTANIKGGVTLEAYGAKDDTDETNSELARLLLGLDNYSWKKIRIHDYPNDTYSDCVFPMLDSDIQNILQKNKDIFKHLNNPEKLNLYKGNYIANISDFDPKSINLIATIEQNQVICNEIYTSRIDNNARSEVYKEYFNKKDQNIQNTENLQIVKFTLPFLDSKTYLKKEITAVVSKNDLDNFKDFTGFNQVTDYVLNKELKSSDIKYDILTRKECGKFNISDLADPKNGQYLKYGFREYCYIKVNNKDEFIVPFKQEYKYLFMLNLHDFEITDMVSIGKYGKYNGPEMNVELWDMLFRKYYDMTFGFNVFLDRDGVKSINMKKFDRISHNGFMKVIPDNDGDMVHLTCNSIGFKCFEGNGNNEDSEDEEDLNDEDKIHLGDDIHIVVRKDKLGEMKIDNGGKFRCNCMKRDCAMCIMSYLTVFDKENCRYVNGFEGEINGRLLVNV